MAAKVFQVIGTVAVVLFGAAFVLMLPFLSGGLKKLNRSMGRRRREVREEIDRSLDEMGEAREQIEALVVLTESARKAMSSAVEGADRAARFLNSRAFQLGLPLLLWSLLLLVALPRGARHVGKPRKRRFPARPPAAP